MPGYSAPSADSAWERKVASIEHIRAWEDRDGAGWRCRSRGRAWSLRHPRAVRANVARCRYAAAEFSGKRFVADDVWQVFSAHGLDLFGQQLGAMVEFHRCSQLNSLLSAYCLASEIAVNAIVIATF